MTNPPKFKVGDTIYWYCDEDGRVHHAEVQYVNYAKVGNYYIDYRRADNGTDKN